MKRVAAAMMAAAVLLTGCAGSTEPAADTGHTIEVFGPYRGAEADDFAQTLRQFQDSTGIAVRYVGSADFVDDLRLRVGEDNDPPDVAIVPQPGLIRELAEQKQIVQPTAEVRAAVDANYSDATAQFGKIDNTLWAIPFRVTVKSLVWYRPSVFAEHGWTVPKSLSDLEKLAADVQSSGALAPWCFSMDADASTGWAATDWVEDIVLRTAGADAYQKWATGDLPFTDTAIASAFNTFHSLVLASGRLYGGVRRAVDTPVESGPEPLVAADPGCALYKQADYSTDWIPSADTIGPDGDLNWFVLPGANASDPPPVLIGGDQIVQFRHDADIDALMAYLAGPDAGTSWVQQGGFVSAKSSIPDSAYQAAASYGTFYQALADLVRTAPVLAFDASDQMPPAIGSDLFWTTITQWVGGVVDYDALAGIMDDAWANYRCSAAPATDSSELATACP